MTLIETVTLFGIMVALAALPSASVALVVTRSATLGVANGVAVTAGFILTLGDIKAIIFYASLFPVFINLSSLHVTDILIIIAVMVVSLGGVKIFYAVSAAKVVSFATSYKFDNVGRKTAGSFLLCAGSYLIIKA